MTAAGGEGRDGFLHGTALYGGDDELLAVLDPFLAAGRDAGDPVLVTLRARENALVRAELDCDNVVFADADEHYDNATRTLAECRSHYDELARDGVTRIRAAGAIPHCHGEGPWESWARFEAVINREYADLPLTGLCLYDARVAAEDVVEDVLGSAARVRSDAQPGRGISTPGRTRWATLARSQVKEHRPDVTVVTVGANDGFPFPGGESGIECCGARWTAEYTRRIRGLMTIYGRSGRAKVLWLTLPIPRDPRRARFTRSINLAVRAAAQGREGVRVLDAHAIFTPDDAYRDEITQSGKTVRVRAEDGIHLSAAGADIAGIAIADAVETAGWLD